ncbi:MAG: NADP-dependent oxidoreductase [Geodermatophilaceae bacterium]|nr:NADP-dependent oxidoreductase [Geodermatophilaceae bacterium]MDQ3464206.1 NADP-dependent oxidoreductase [Actinomycetota bacterium]
MTPRSSREVQLASRPQGLPTPQDFALVERPLPDLDDGQVLVRNLLMSVDPYMRGRMNDVPSYVPPFQLDQALEGGAVGEVIESRSDSMSIGDIVLHGLGWRDFAVGAAGGFRRVDPAAAPLSAYLGVLGMPGLTAYAGLLEVAAMKEGDVVFVSGAAGAVGSLVGQIAKLKGASRVIGSAGSAAKVEHVLGLGFDAAFDYKQEPVRRQLRDAAPDGIDVYFDNVGGDHLEAAIGSLRLHGRVALCGAISAYNETQAPPGPRNLALAIGRRLTLRGFIVNDHNHLRGVFTEDVGGWLREGRLRWEQTTVQGLENAPAAFIGLLQGENTGKMIVELAGERL